jgi:cytochrome c biogenesis protein CcmG/thiol:disulfide interchange protein DsbE
MRTRNLFSICAAAIAAIAVCQTPSKFDTFVGKPAPAFKMTDLAGKSWTNKSLLGKVVILDFWATWCGPCKQASPFMDKLYKKYKSKGLVVIGAETLDAGDPAQAKSYANEHGYSYVFTTKNESLGKALDLPGLPSFVVIGKDGKIARTQTGLPAKIADLYPSFEKTVRSLL